MKFFNSKLPFGGKWALFALSLLLCAYASITQTSYLAGKVIDRYGALTGASVKAFSGTDSMTSVITDLNGAYRLSLEPGIYSIEFSAYGFETWHVDSVEVSISKAGMLTDAFLQYSTTTGVVLLPKTLPLTEEQIAKGDTVHQVVFKPALPGTYTYDGPPINAKGSRSNSINYYTESFRVPGSSSPGQDNKLTGWLTGKVTDGKDPIIGANVKVMHGVDFVRGGITDLAGEFKVSLEPGTYDVEISYTGYQSQRVQGVQVLSGQVNFLPEVIMQNTVLSEVVVTSYKVPVIQQDRTSSGQTLTSQDIKKTPTRSTAKKAKAAEKKTSIDGGAVNIKGSRNNSTNYYIDGIRVSGATPPVSEFDRQQKLVGRPAPKPLPDDIMVEGGKMKRIQIAFEPETYEEKVMLVDLNDDELQGLIDSFPQEVSAAELYNTIVENPFQDAKTNNISTFSIDVDAASYSNVRRYLNSSNLPPANAVRIEEMVNYFDYQYNPPAGADPFEANVEVAPCPWNPENRLMMIGLQGLTIDIGQLPASNFVFLIDVSGSMQEENKLPLVQQSLVMLTDQLRANDHVAIVVYAGAAGLVLESTAGTDKIKIKEAIEKLQAGGSTAGGEGIKLAYDTALKNFVTGGNNRVILCTDGDFNVGLSSEDELVKLIENERQSGVYLTVLGFGEGNYQDGTMQSLADKGNGNHAYIDQLSEAKKVLIKEFGGTLFAIAKDVKLQLHFNPDLIAGYRLIGYENRLLATEDFQDDTKDAGELGAGHRVTALYELVPKGRQLPALSKLDSAFVVTQKPDKDVKINASDLMVLQLRYKKPKGDAPSRLMEYRLNAAALDRKTESLNFKLASAVAEFGMLLRDSKYKGAATYAEALARARETSIVDPNGYRAELAGMIELAGKLAGELK